MANLHQLRLITNLLRPMQERKNYPSSRVKVPGSNQHTIYKKLLRELQIEMQEYINCSGTLTTNVWDLYQQWLDMKLDRDINLMGVFSSFEECLLQQIDDLFGSPTAVRQSSPSLTPQQQEPRSCPSCRIESDCSTSSSSLSEPESWTESGSEDEVEEKTEQNDQDAFLKFKFSNSATDNKPVTINIQRNGQCNMQREGEEEEKVTSRTDDVNEFFTAMEKIVGKEHVDRSRKFYDILETSLGNSSTADTTTKIINTLLGHPNVSTEETKESTATENDQEKEKTESKPPSATLADTVAPILASTFKHLFEPQSNSSNQTSTEQPAVNDTMTAMLDFFNQIKKCA